MSDYNFAYLDRADQADDPPRHSEALQCPAIRCPLPARDADALWLGHGRGAGICRPVWCRGSFEGNRQGADDHTNAGRSAGFFRAHGRVATTTRTADCHADPDASTRIPGRPLTRDQILVYQVPIPEPLRFWNARTEDPAKRCTT